MALPQIVVTVSELLNPEFQVNSYTASSQTLPSVIALAGGGWVVVWMSSGQDGDGTGIYGQRYDADGGTLGGEFRINTTTAAGQAFPSVAALDDGGWVATWMSGDGDGFGVYGQRYDAAGNAVGTEFIINTTTDADQVNPDVIGLADGGWLVAWDSDNLIQDGSRQGIYAQRFDENGNTVGQEFQINTYTNLDQWYPSQAALVDGGWITTWISNGQDGSEFGIYGRRYDADGVALGAEFQINTYASANQWFQSVAPLADGGWVVTWGSEGQDGSSFGIYGQRYSASGTRSGPEFLVNTTTDAEQNFPSVTGLTDGGWIVTWGSRNQDGSGFGIFGQRYAADGSQDGAEFQINTEAAFDQRFPSVTALPDGNWVVVWESLFQDGSEFGIHGQQLSTSFMAAGAADFIEDSSLFADGSLVTDPDGVGEINWQWQRSVNGGGSWTDITGATGDSYVPNDDDVGNLLRLQGTYLDGLAVQKTVFSAASSPIINVNDMPVGFAAAIGGKAEVNSLLTAAATVSSDDDGLPDPLSFSYQWQAASVGGSWVDIAGATGASFTPGIDETGLLVRVIATYTDARGTAESTASAATAPVYPEGSSFLLTASVASVSDVPLFPTLSMMEYDSDGELFLRPVQLSADQVVYELVARPALQSGSLDFQLSSASPLIDFTLTDALAGWTVQQSSANPATVTVSAEGAGDGSDHLAAGNEVVIATFYQLGEAGASLTAAAVGERAVAGQVLDDTILQQLGTSDHTATIANGSTGLVGGQLDYENSSRAIGAQDALEALRLAVGLQTTKGTADAFDFIAADFNRDGRVGAQDALEILRYAVGLSDSLDTSWVFVDGNGDLAGVSRQDVSYQSGAAWTAADADTEISLVGVLVGDVNDSFNPV